MWQRLTCAQAVLEVFERGKEFTIDKNADLEEAYKRRASVVIKEYENVLPIGLTAEILWRDTLKKEFPKLKGKQLFESIWETCSRSVVNKIMPAWMKVGPYTSDGKIKSGVQSFDPYLLKLREYLFDQEFNQMSKLQNLSSSTMGSSSTPTPANLSASYDSDDDDGDGTSVIGNADSQQQGGAVGPSSIKKRGRKKREPGTRKEFDPTWYPMEWLAFLVCGPLSSKPHEKWVAFKFYSQGPL